MNVSKKKVLMIATSRQTKGGISAVIKAYEQSLFWEEFNVRWLETHRDGTKIMKAIVALYSYALSFILIPQYSIIHIHLSEIPSLVRKLPIFLFCKLLRKKTILHFHSFSVNTTIHGRGKFLYRFVFSNADKVIVLSSSWKNWLSCYLNIIDNVVVVYNPCDPSIHSSSLEEREKKILYAGALNARKGYSDLIYAFSKISSNYPDWELVFAGNGDIADGEKKARELSIEKKVKFTGWISGDEKRRYFSTASIFCLPSYAEGFPTAIIEACSYGIALITTPVGGIPDILVDGENGLLFEPGDIQLLSEHLQLLITNAEYRDSLSMAAKKLSETTFSMDRISENIKNIYMELLLR